MSGFGNNGSFGASNNPFGGSSSNSASFGNPSSIPQSSSNPFGGSNSGGGGMSFGASPNVMVAPSSGFGSTGFGTNNNNNNNSFGNTSFGTNNNNSFGGFSSQQIQTNSSSSFGGNPFGSGSQSQPPSTNPFGGGQSSTNEAQPTITFGASSNVMMTSDTTTTTRWGGNSGFSTNADLESTTAFGGGFGQTKNSDAVGFGQTKNSNAAGFGQTNSDAASNNPFTSSFGKERTSVFSSSTQEDGGPSKDSTPKNISSINTAHKEMEEKKRALKAKIEERKRLLAEKQQQKKKRQEEADRRSKSPPNSRPAQDAQQQSLAERNTLRFAKHQVKSQSTAAPSTTSAIAEREDLKDAVNLVGLCQTMCPDDELTRRQNETDIQALEIPLPGQLHPQGWTLKDTAIKRFRRSAADYKLDVPEWVRPPEVLERTMGYLEEWIMERDRQGPDSRFPQKDVPPPSLDVYQFIWDRTRMIRKDFILQNYVGTGGRCDAKAVRCHERIARWHAMCEHQLSHIDDFVSMQSQQNMQELGQTMKTLNSFYDDALRRSTKEIPDDKTGMETYVPETNHTSNRNNDENHASNGGCRSETVQGQNPVDYNGQPLNNEGNNPMIGGRLIGKNNNSTKARGTAEPEMRGLYMLMILENEGGMEVLKYAAKLFKERPAVYHSPPVQLALNIFKAWKDMNYVKFFSILRSPDTPYLFSCIMFKHVEVMRRIAITIMSISYGARNKSTGEAMYDEYPLERLVRLLCFEDLEEAKAACKFYNIKVVEYTSQRTGVTKDIICWKGSRFKIPKDPEKGHELRLQPRKMTRTIEKKLNGTTRLGVCRGDVSGKGAALFDSPNKLDPGAAPFKPFSASTSSVRDPEMEAKAQQLLMKQKLEQAKLMKEAKKEEERKRKAKEKLELQEKQKKLEEQRRRERKEREQAEFERRKQEEILKKEEARRKRLEEEERIKRRQEEEQARKLAAERARREAEEAARKQKEMEEQRKREEEERQRLEMERRLAEERRKKELEEQERKRKEEEARRREIQRRELEAKRKREAEERRRALEWQNKIDAATKLLFWHHWKRALSRPLENSVGTRKSFGGINPLFTRDNINLVDFSIEESLNYNKRSEPPMIRPRPTCKQIIEESIAATNGERMPRFSVADLALQEVESISKPFSTVFGSRKTTLLLKVALICPESTDIKDQSFTSLLYHWIGSYVSFGMVESATSSNLGDSRSNDARTRCEIRSVIVKGSNYEVCSSCDLALVVIPPRWSYPDQKATDLYTFVSSVLDDDIPRVALALSDSLDASQVKATNNMIASEVGGTMEAIPIIQPSQLSFPGFEQALKMAFQRIAKIFIHETSVSMMRIPAMELATKTIRAILWLFLSSDRMMECRGTILDEDVLIESSRLALQTLVEELVHRSNSHNLEWSQWPAPEFITSKGTIGAYFANEEEGGLPYEWMSCLGQDFLQEALAPLLHALRGPFRDAYQRIVIDAPIIVQDDCASDCAHGRYRRCLEKSVLWMQEASSRSSQKSYLYLPDGMVEEIVNAVVVKIKQNPLFTKLATTDVPLLTTEDSTTRNTSNSETIHKSTGITSSDATVSKRSRAATNRSGEEFSTKKQRREESSNSLPPPSEQTSHFRTPLPATRTTTESYAQKLERWLHGEETVDVKVGDSSLSRYLRDVPKPQLG